MVSKYEINYIYDDPVKFKNLSIYPVTMRDYFQFHYFANVLMLDKNSVPDPKVISMSYLEYLFYTHSNENPNVFILDALLKLCLRKKEENFNYFFDKNKKPVFVIDGETYDSSDFDEIKKIISEQNSLDLPDENIQKEVRDKIRESEELRRKINNQKMCSLEDQIICVLISTSMNLNEIYDVSIRKFSKILQRVDHKLHYEIYLSASMSGFVEFKDKSFIKHWMMDLNKDGNENVVEVQSVQEKISFNDKK